MWGTAEDEQSPVDGVVDECLLLGVQKERGFVKNENPLHGQGVHDMLRMNRCSRGGATPVFLMTVRAPPGAD